jgi:hypothetical protein
MAHLCLDMARKIDEARDVAEEGLRLLASLEGNRSHPGALERMAGKPAQSGSHCWRMSSAPRRA